jgi:acetoin utilization deacetylase AcuC-like enzyme
MTHQPPVLIVNDERFALHLERMPHMESFRRFRAAAMIFDSPQLKGLTRTVSPRPATVDELALVHTPDYIRKIAASRDRPLTAFDLDTQATQHSYDVARLATGAVFNLLDEIRSGTARRGFACVRPPGHHAEPDRAMGFCLFNHVALGVRYLQQRHHAKKIMIVDIDAHHGNGTQKVFYASDDVLYFSLHQFPGYPGSGNFGETGEGKGEGFTVNVPLRQGSGDRDVARAIYFLLNPIATAFRPEMILVSCGFDFYQHDRLCRMAVTPEGYALMTFLLLDIAEKFCDGRILFVMEGGYSLRGIRECGLRVMQELCDIGTLTRKTIDKVTAADPATLPFLQKVYPVQKKYWKNII